MKNKTATGINVSMASSGIRARQELSEKTFNQMAEAMFSVATTPNYASILRGRIVGFQGTSTPVNPSVNTITDYMGKGGKCILVECCHHNRWSEGSDVGVCQQCIDYCKKNPKSRIQKVVEYGEVIDRILGNNGAKIAGPEPDPSAVSWKSGFSMRNIKYPF